MPATKGHLIVLDLIGDDTTPAMFSIKQRVKPLTAPPSRAHHRGKGFSLDQLAVMGRLATSVATNPSSIDEFGLDFATDPRTGRPTLVESTMSQYLGLEGTDQLVGAEYLLRGDTRDWDAVYDAGGLGANVKDVRSGSIDTGKHVESSSGTSAFVPCTRQLGVSKHFAGKTGWVYLFHVNEGIAMSDHKKYQQDEVLAFGEIPLHDIVMCKWVEQANRIYVNREFRAAMIDSTNWSPLLRLIGGGTYAQGQFWVIK
ncbi:MAG: hypothetical protein IPM24_17905 [Bryobacterales bacterium]|nr:hypothetical protein [Bryobacterales bacterium]